VVRGRQPRVREACGEMPHTPKQRRRAAPPVERSRSCPLGEALRMCSGLKRQCGRMHALVVRE
jgi:hypothetical protein